MKKLLILCSLLALYLPSFCQTDDNAAIKKIINNMFDSMRRADTIDLRNTFVDGMVLQSINARKDKPDSLSVVSADAFVKIIGAPHKDIYDEKITISEVNIDNNLATVIAPYKFYFGKKFSHCGIDVFQLMKTGVGWKIVSIFYNVRTGNCPN
jgi:Putative lumazine-binding